MGGTADAELIHHLIQRDASYSSQLRKLFQPLGVKQLHAVAQVNQVAPL